ncbi:MULTISPECIES: EpsG family protein [unclassified Cupriavidus]|nr:MULTISPECIES: EpsG family protein [unclassified Cupriavidus]
MYSMISQDLTPNKRQGAFLEYLQRMRIPVVGIVILVVLLPLAATRGGLVTADTDIYIRIFEEYDPADGLFGGHFAPAFTALSWIAKYFNLEVGGYFWIVAGVGVTLKLIGIHRCSRFFLASVLVYLSKYFLLHEFAQVRAGIASAIFLCGVPYLSARKPWRYLLSILGAAAFHPSAFLYLAAYPLGSQRWNNRQLVVCAALGASLVYLLNFNGALFAMVAQVFPKVEVYIDLLAEGQYAEINLFNVEAIIKIAIWFALCNSSSGLRARFKYFDVLFRVWTLSLIVYFAFSGVPVFAFRASELFDIVSIPLLPALLVAFKNRLIGVAAFLLVLGLFVVNFYFIQPIIL